MQTVYATVIRDRQDFWDYPTDLIGVYPTRKAAEESLKTWLEDFGFDETLIKSLVILREKQDQLTIDEQFKYEDADNINHSISIVPIEFGSYIDIGETDNEDDVIDLLKLIESK